MFDCLSMGAFLGSQLKCSSTGLKSAARHGNYCDDKEVRTSLKLNANPIVKTTELETFETDIME